MKIFELSIRLDYTQTRWRCHMSLHRDTYAEINLKYLKENIETTYKKFKTSVNGGN